MRDIEVFEGLWLNEKISNKRVYNKLSTYNNKIKEIVDNEDLKNKLIIILGFFKNKLLDQGIYIFNTAF